MWKQYIFYLWNRCDICTFHFVLLLSSRCFFTQTCAPYWQVFPLGGNYVKQFPLLKQMVHSHTVFSLSFDLNHFYGSMRLHKLLNLEITLIIFAHILSQTPGQLFFNSNISTKESTFTTKKTIQRLQWESLIWKNGGKKLRLSLYGR